MTYSESGKGEIGLTVLQGVILGIIQGLAEFLPVSSSGHLVLFQKLFGLQEGNITFDIAVHIATLAAVIVVMRKDVLGILRKPFGKLPLLIVAGTIPTGIIALIFSEQFRRLFETGKSLGLGFILTGLVLWYSDRLGSGRKGLEKMGYADAIVVGIAQGIAILPAVSRSGMTISGGLFRGLSREFALRFSFLMSIPAILLAAAKDVYDILKAGAGFDIGVGVLPLAAGMAAAAVSGYIAVRFMLRIFSKVSFKVFSYYVFVLGAFVLADQIFFGRFFERLFF